MTWTYTGAPGTGSSGPRRDAVRLLVKDTVQTSQLLSDEELAFFLSQHSQNVYQAAADACEQIGAREAKSKSVGDLSISGFTDTYQTLATRYRMLAAQRVTAYAGGISVTDKQAAESDTDRVQPAFTRALHETVAGLTATTGP